MEKLAPDSLEKMLEEIKRWGNAGIKKEFMAGRFLVKINIIDTRHYIDELEVLARVYQARADRYKKGAGEVL